MCLRSCFFMPHPRNKVQGTRCKEQGSGQPAMNRSKQAGMARKPIIVLLVGLTLASVRWRQGRACSRSGIGSCSLDIRVRKSHTASLAPVRCVALGRAGNWLCHRSLPVALRIRVVCQRIDSGGRGRSDHRAEVVTLHSLSLCLTDGSGAPLAKCGEFTRIRRISICIAAASLSEWVFS